MEKHLILYRSTNSKGKRDATGAFIPEAIALSKILGRSDDVEVLRFPRSFTKVPRINLSGNFESISVFCHGWVNGVELLPSGRSGASQMARYMKEHSCKYLNLFACSAANEGHSGGCYARWVSEECHNLGHRAQVFGHETAGHTSWNPKARFYWSTSRGVETERAVDPMRDGWDEWRAFRKRMKNDQEYCLMLPFMYDEFE